MRPKALGNEAFERKDSSAQFSRMHLGKTKIFSRR
jgi:hypothetical protein